MISRRRFITNTIIALTPLSAGVGATESRAQQQGKVVRIGWLDASATPTNAAPSRALTAFGQRLNELGWVEGRNLRMDVRWAPGSVDRMRTFARELVELQPDVILANSTPVTAALQRETRTIPIVFAVASDPVGSGFAASLAAPVEILPGSALQNRRCRVSGWSC